METLFQNVLTASFHGSIVILTVMLLRLVLKRTPKKFICLLWLLAGIRLLMPFEIQSSLSLQPETPVTGAYWEYTAEDYPVFSQDVVQDPEITQPAGKNPTGTEAVAGETPDMQPQKPAVRWDMVIPWIWLAGACSFAVYSLISYLSLKRKVRFAVQIPGGWECDAIGTAFILGFVRPQIYIPMGMSPTVRKHILAHERTHLEKGDHWFKMIGFLALALHWFNPLVWAAYILLCKDIEMACDERVVQFMELEERKEYSAALLSCSTNRGHFAACPVAFGEVSVKYRIRSVLGYHKPGFWISLVGVAAIFFVAVCLVTSPAGEPAQPEEATAAGTTAGETEMSVQWPDTQLETLVSMFAELEAGDAHASAQFRDGTGYNFFPYEAEELVQLLMQLTAEDFLREPELSSIMSVSLEAGGTQLEFQSDTQLVVLLYEGELWGIRDEALAGFFRTLYSVTDYEEYNVAPLGELRENYSMEEAMIDLCVIQEDGALRYNGEVWDSFYAACTAGTPATVRLYQRTNGETCVRDLSYDENGYKLYWYEDGRLCSESWQQLLRFAGDCDAESQMRCHYDHFILTNDPDCTWDEDSHTLCHSTGYQEAHHENHHDSGSQVGGSYHQICSRYTYYPNNPVIPDGLDKVTLELDGEVIGSVVEQGALEEIRVLFENAEETYEPKTYSLGPELVLWFEGRTVRVQLELNSDLCVIDGIFYDYGPGFDDNGSLDRLPELLRMLGCTEWPDQVKDRYGEYIWW